MIHKAIVTVPKPPTHPAPRPPRHPAKEIRALGQPLQKPGEHPVRPGEYEERGRRGGRVPKPRKVTIEPRDTPLPPTQKPGRRGKRTGPPRP